MKKILTLIFSFLAVNLTMADNYLDGSSQLYFAILDDGTAEIVCSGEEGSESYTNLSGELTIPETVYNGSNGYTVTSIGSHAFYKCSITSVDIPITVTNISTYAFSNTSLTSIYIPKSVQTIAEYAFGYCSYLEKIIFDPDSQEEISIGTKCFYRVGREAASPLAIEFSKGVGSLPQQVFYRALIGSMKFDYESYVTDIGMYAFQEISDSVHGIIKTIELPEGIESLEKRVFWGDYSIETLVLPSTLTEIGEESLSLTSYGYSAISKFYCKATTPPSVDMKESTNGGIYGTDNATLYVPTESVSAYQSEWAAYFSNIQGYDFPDFKYNDIYYKIIEDNQVQVVSGPIPYEGEIEIPTTFTRNKTEYTVSSIASDAFSNIDGDLLVTVSFTNPSLILTDETTVVNSNVTLKAPDGYKEIFEASDLTESFTIAGDPITDSYGNSYYYYYNSEDDEELLLELVAIADGVTDLTIPESIDGVDVKSIAEGVITSDLTSVTLQAKNPQFKAETFKDVATGTVLYVGENIENYVTEGNDYHEYFVVYGYIEAKDTFSDGTFKYIVLENEEKEGIVEEDARSGDTVWTVKITDIVTSETTFTIGTSVDYNGLTFTVTSIDATAFTGKTGLSVSVTFSDPATVKIIISESSEQSTIKVGSLNVPSDNVTAFGQSDWATYFEVANYNYGTVFAENGVSYQVNQDNESVTIVAFSCAESVTIPEKAGGYTVNAVANGVFNCEDLKSVTIEATTPPFKSSAFAGIPEGVVLYVGDNIDNYTTTEDNWHNYFVIYGYIEIGDTFELDGLEYKVITNTETIEIIGITASEVEIKTAISYNNLNFTVTSIADGAFSNAENLSVTVDAGILSSITLGMITEGNIGELNVPEGSEWDYYLSSWANYFTINATLSFSTDYLIYTVTDQTRKYVEITGVVENVTEFEITTTVKYNEDIEFTVKSINEYAFDDCSGLQVTVAFTNPSAVYFNGYYAETLGTLTVTSDGYRDLFASTNWGKYFEVKGNPYTQDGVNYYFQRDGSATVYSIDPEVEIIFTDKVNGYTVEEIAESVFENCANLTVAVTVINPYTITLETRTTSGKYGILTVPDGCSSIYAETTWGDYFDIKATDYYDGGAGVYYVFIVTAVEYDDEDFEDDTNKSLKATSVKYEISLEVAYVDADATEITIPRTVDLGDSSSTYEVTSMNADALKDCKDLVTINLEASIPVEDIEALNYTPDACVIVVDEEKMGTEYCESVMAAASMVGIEVKMVSTAIVEIQVTTDKVEVARYNLLGQKVNAPVRGINIVKYSDGTVEKVLVK